MFYAIQLKKSASIIHILLSFVILPNIIFAQADLVIINANIRTIDEKNSRAEAVAVVKNRITAIGSNREIRTFIRENTKVIDAEGKLILPGFNDSHVHFAAMGSQFFSIDLRNAKSAREILEKIKFHAAFLPKDAWILGSGWNNDIWGLSDFPEKNSIDSAAPENPVFLYSSDAKRVLVNSLTLKLARLDKKITNQTILDESSVNSVKIFVPKFATDNKALVLETASNYAAAFGVTSVQDVSADDNTEIYRQLARQGKLKTRVYECIALSDWQKPTKNNIKKASGEGILRRGCLKGIADGDAESTPKLYEEILAADKNDLQVMVHAIGARANEQILSIFERVIKANGKKDRRFRVEHAHGFRPPDVRRFARSNIIASVQPFLFSDETGKSTDPLRNLLDAKTTLAFGSDSSMISVNPLLGIAAAVNANDPKQKISVEEAVRFYTLGSAYAEFQENEKGSITVGKLADFVVLSDDIFTIKLEEIGRTRVLKTIVDGRVVYETN